MAEKQAAILAPTMQDLSVQFIVKDAGGAGATKKLAQRKLNSAGAITNHYRLQNNPEWVQKLLAAVQLAASLAEISALTKATKEHGKCKADTELIDLAPASLVKLNSKKVNGGVTKLSKKEIYAISFRYFGCMYKEANPKPVLVAGLRGLLLRSSPFSLRRRRLPPRLRRPRRPRRPREARFRKKTMASSSQGLGDVEAHSL
jgi:hypothetical protein